MPTHEKINYVEFPAQYIEATQQFFEDAFGFKFESFGADYIAFSDAGLDGGFYRAKVHASAAQGSALIVFYSEDLEATLEKIKKYKGKIVQDIFSFPGGRRFHFSDPSDNEFAVWSES